MDKNYNFVIQKLTDSGFEVEYLYDWNGNFENLHRMALKQLRYEFMFYMPLLALSEIIKGNYNSKKYSSDFTINDEYKEKFLTGEIQDTLLLLFGECYFFEQAGYLLPNGKLLDFAEGGECRQDHRFVKGIVEELILGQFETYTSGLYWMEDNGAIRIQNNGFEVATKMTSQQIKTISICRKHLKEMHVDVVLNHNHHENPVSKTFCSYAGMDEIINFIDESFKKAKSIL